MFKIGDFSKFTRVSVRMLRHYDEIGLLKPQFTDKYTGYRFYSVEQISKVNQIQVLKEMGFTLSEIIGLTESNFDLKQLRSLLMNRKRQIAETMEIEKEKLFRVEALIKYISKEDFDMKHDITVKNIPAYKVVSLRDIISKYNAEGKLWEELQEFVTKNNIKAIEPCYAIYHDTGYKENDVDVEVTMVIENDFDTTNRIKIRKLEEVTEMAIIFHRGNFEEMDSAYHALGIWVNSNGYEVNGPTRAIYHRGSWNEKNPTNYLTEIQTPVIKKS